MLDYCLNVHFPDGKEEHLFTCLLADGSSVFALEVGHGFWWGKQFGEGERVLESLHPAPWQRSRAHGKPRQEVCSTDGTKNKIAAFKGSWVLAL